MMLSKTIIMELNKWLTEKPNFVGECVFVTANKYRDVNEYKIWMTLRVRGEDGDYLGLFTGDGDEWGDLEDLHAQLYMVISMPT